VGKKIIRVRKLDPTKDQPKKSKKQESPTKVTSGVYSRVTASNHTHSIQIPGGNHTHNISTTPTITATTSSNVPPGTALVWPNKPDKEAPEFSHTELEKKDQWTTAEAAWYCGISTTTWHVYAHKGRGITPVRSGRGRGKQNMYAAKDVKNYKNLLDSKAI
jgi:hypothetical protein